LRSRKARMEGDWKLSSGTYTYSAPSFGTNTTETYNGSTKTTTGTLLGLPVNTTKPYTLEIKILKDGTYEEIENDDGDMTTTKGIWNFAGGVGEIKNKSQLVMKATSVTDSNGTATVSGNEYDDTYDIYELKNKEMILKWNSSSSATSATGEWTLTQ